ncbi:uncharacterized protein LOC123555679 [Mercenaria mercenaria]|uniref:uncharacterized protein LOC123555679 n=1 Tax=Mercenaria mercenaria TaxID=6596 RepID=UPI00234E8745|nr:uncharacterized protein LOC123555679 [Mercenaria mercenaria]
MTEGPIQPYNERTFFTKYEYLLDSYILPLQNSQEFRAIPVQTLMKKHCVIYSPTQNETKSSTAERANLTIRSKIIRYFTYKDDYNYIPILEDIADSYNQTIHRTIGMAPADVNDANEEEVRLSTYFAHKSSNKEISKATKKRYMYKIGDFVRVTQLKDIFTRA